jgi:CRP/FNR family transcriptional regulator, cyclic AMP receptor protein
MPCDIREFDDIDFFEHLSEADRAVLAEVVDAHQLAPGATLFNGGDPGESLFVVRKGEIEIYIKDTAGQKIILNVARAGDIFGELALLDSGARTATAVALEDSDLLELDRDDLLVLFRRTPEAALRLLAAMGHMTRKADELLRTRVSRNANEEVAENLTLLQRIADWIAWFSGSMSFLLLNLAWFGVWILANVANIGIPHFDPYPFGLLTMIVSLEAIFLSCFVLISQNRQSEKDHVRSDIEYEVNIKAELEVAHLHEKTDRIHEEMLLHFSQLEKLLAPARSVLPVSRPGEGITGRA